MLQLKDYAIWLWGNKRVYINIYKSSYGNAFIYMNPHMIMQNKKRKVLKCVPERISIKVQPILQHKLISNTYIFIFNNKHVHILYSIIFIQNHIILVRLFFKSIQNAIYFCRYTSIYIYI